MSLRDQFATDAKKETDGVPIEFGENDDKTVPTFFVSRMGPGNKEYTKALERATRPVQQQIERKTLAPEKSEAIMQDVFIKHVLKGWQNVKTADVNGSGEGDAPFTPANAKALFAALPDLYLALLEGATSAANFRTEALEEQAKN